MSSAAKKYINICLSVILCCLVLSSCSNNNQQDDGKLKVVTTNFASYDFARQIGGDEIDVQLLMDPGVETHSYEPSPQDIIMINECDVFIYVGGENEDWVNGILDTLDSEELEIIKLMDCVEVVEEEIVEGMEHEHDEHNEHDEHDEHDEHEDNENWDEHVWTSPDNAIKICKTIEDLFSKIDAENAKNYESAYNEYEAKLVNLDNAFKDIMKNAKRHTIVFGDRFPVRYFVEEYDIEYFAAFPGCSSDTEASASTIAFLIDKVKNENIPVVFKIELSNGNIADTISEETGAKVLTFYSCHNLSKEDFDKGKTYLDFMWENVEALKIALN